MLIGMVIIIVMWYIRYKISNNKWELGNNIRVIWVKIYI